MAQPTAPYDVAQAIVVQGHALNTANARIQELEAAGARPASSWPWGLLADAFGRPGRGRRGLAADASKDPGFNDGGMDLGEDF